MSKTSKELHWQELTEYFAHVVDGIGGTVDAGIFEAVVALNALGIHTSASCEGHLDHGQAAPWIDIGDPDAEHFEKEVYRKMDVLEEVPRGQPTSLWQEIEEARLAAKRLHQIERQKVVILLDQFYGDDRERIVSSDVRLVLNQWEYCGIVRLESMGATIQDVLSPSEQARHLDLYHEEMDRFARFLHDLYWSLPDDWTFLSTKIIVLRKGKSIS